MRDLERFDAGTFVSSTLEKSVLGLSHLVLRTCTFSSVWEILQPEWVAKMLDLQLDPGTARYLTLEHDMRVNEDVLLVQCDSEAEAASIERNG